MEKKTKVTWIWELPNGKFFKEVNGKRFEISEKQFNEEALEKPVSFTVDYNDKKDVKQS